MFKGLFISHVSNLIEMLLIIHLIWIKRFTTKKLNYVSAVSLLGVVFVFFPSIGKSGQLPFGNKIGETVVGEFLCVELVVEDVPISPDGGFKLGDGWGERFFKLRSLFDEPLSLCMFACPKDGKECREENGECDFKDVYQFGWHVGYFFGIGLSIVGMILGFYLSRLNIVIEHTAAFSTSILPKHPLLARISTYLYQISCAKVV